MSKIYFTLTGTKYYHGNEFLKPGMKLKLKKETSILSRYSEKTNQQKRIVKMPLLKLLGVFLFLLIII